MDTFIAMLGISVLILFVYLLSSLIIQLIKLENNLPYDPRFGFHNPRDTPLEKAYEKILKSEKREAMDFSPSNTVWKYYIDQLNESHQHD